MIISIIKSITTFFTSLLSVHEEPPLPIGKILTVQDASKNLLDLYSSNDLRRCEEIADLQHTLDEALSFNPLTPVNTLPESKRRLIRKYL